jgi:hypothetical protein
MGRYKNQNSGVDMGEPSKRENQVHGHEQYLHTIARCVPVLGEEEEAKLIRRWQDRQDIAARNKLIESHLRLVPRIARWTANKCGFRPPSESPQEAWDGYEICVRNLSLRATKGYSSRRAGSIQNVGSDSRHALAGQ